MAEQTEGAITIDAEPRAVMDVIEDYAAYPEWADVRSIEVRATDDQGRGTEVAFQVSAAGMSAAYTLAYEYRSGHAGVAWTTREAEGAVRDVSGEYVLEAEEGGTRVTYRLQVETSVPLPGFIRRQAEKKIIRGALEGLKKRVEGK